MPTLFRRNCALGRTVYCDMSLTSVHSKQHNNNGLAMKIICIANQKGGVGKTTLAFHLVHYLAELGNKVAAIDIDGQENFSLSFLQEKLYSMDDISYMTSTDLFLGNTAGKKLYEAYENIYLLPGTDELSEIADKASDVVYDFYQSIESGLKGKDIDYLVIDTPPALGNLQFAGLLAADYVVIPTQPHGFAEEGMLKLSQSIALANEERSELGLDESHVIGAVLNLVNTRAPKETKKANRAQEVLGKLCCEQRLTIRAGYAEATDRTLPVWKIRSSANVAAGKEFKRLAAELMKKASKMDSEYRKKGHTENGLLIADLATL